MFLKSIQQKRRKLFNTGGKTKYEYTAGCKI